MEHSQRRQHGAHEEAERSGNGVATVHIKKGNVPPVLYISTENVERPIDGKNNAETRKLTKEEEEVRKGNCPAGSWPERLHCKNEENGHETGEEVVRKLSRDRFSQESLNT